MHRQRGGLVPIGDAVSGLDDVLVPAIPSASPQTRHSFTVADQVNQLVAASEADPDLGFMARTMALCSLPRTNPGNQHQYKRKNGPFELVMIAGADNKTALRELPPITDGLGFDRSGTDSKPFVGPGFFTIRLHANARHLPQQRRTGRRSNPAP